MPTAHPAKHSAARAPFADGWPVATLEEWARPDCSCGRPAKLVVELHQVDCCDRSSASNVEITHSGGTMHLLCVECARRLHELIARDLERRLSRLPAGSRMACNTCGRPIRLIHDVMELETL